MTRLANTLGIILPLALVVGAMNIASASAAQFHTAAAPATITGNQQTSHVLTTNAGTVTCTVTKFTGTMSALASSSLKLTPTWENCTAFGFIGIKRDTNGCAFVLGAAGSTGIECPTGKAIEITNPFCTTSIGPQTLASGMSYSTQGSTPNRIILATINVSGITYNECGTVRTNGTYTGTTKLTGSAGEIWFL